LFDQTLERKTQLSLSRLTSRLQAHFAKQIKTYPEDWQAFSHRLEEHFPVLFSLFFQLYSGQYDFYYQLEQLLIRSAESWFARSADLKALDIERESDPNWFQSNQMVGGVCYVDLFAGDLEGIKNKIPYFKELGLTYLHLMPLFKMPEGENDGGYAVSSYREVHPPLGTIAQLETLAADLRREGISLVLDFVLNHTANDHKWAQRALNTPGAHKTSSDPNYREYYFIFPDRQIPDAYEQNLREIFPDEHPGAFSQLTNGDWVWTTFHSYQWDLNYANPAVFNQMAAEMLFLANLGTEVLRLDALAFTWKRLGTVCESLPEAHLLIQALNVVTRIAAPALLFKSEAIVHPDEVAQYIGLDECQLSYNPLLMAMLWNSLATRKINLLQQALRDRFQIHSSCAWVNYVRCHDDIGWTFSDEDAARLGIDGFGHRQFLNAFYTGRFPDSFARGLPFQENPKTGDARISGTCASLAGLEKALREETETEVELAIRRILLIHAIILTIGGIPLIYLGDEVGTLNDYAYSDDPAKAGDSRWVHRPTTNWDRGAKRLDEKTIEGRIFRGFIRLINLRKSHLSFSGSIMQMINTGNESVLGYLRSHNSERTLIFANFSEREQTIPANVLRLYGLGYEFTNLLNGNTLSCTDLNLTPYKFVCLSG
jgi:amylosucrase